MDSNHIPENHSATQLLLVDKAGPVVWTTLARPRCANALNLQLVEELFVALRRAEEDPDVRVIVFTGEGQHFCAGADLRELQSGRPEHIRLLMNKLRDFFLALESSSLVIIAAVHGAARAGGLELCLACDVVVATSDATFGDAHLSNGLLPAGGATVRLPRTIGWARAKWLILSGQSIDAHTAQAWGLVLEVCPPGCMREVVERLSSAFTAKDRGILHKAKNLLAKLPDRTFDASLEAEIATLVEHSSTSAFQKSLRSFFEKRGGQADDSS